MEPGKILIYRNELLPLSETFVLSQATMLRRFQPLFGGLARVSRSLNLAPHSVVTLCSSESPVEKIKRRVFLRTGYAAQLMRLIETQNLHVIHAHFAVDACAVLPLAQKLRLPLVVTLHGYDVSCGEDVFKRWPTTRAYLRRREELWEYASLFICVSKYVQQRAIAAGFPEKKLWIHHIGVEQSDEQQDHIRDRRTVLFVGRLVEKKGCIHLIHAMSHVQEVIPEARLVIAGDGPLREALETEATLHCKKAIFLGYQSHTAIKRWTQQACVLAVPSVRARSGDAEGLPTVICEAQAEGLPVVAFATEGVTEALPLERRDTLSRAGDVAALAEEIIRLMSDEKAWQLASDAGRRYVRAHFDLTVQTQLLEDRYEEIIARCHG